MERQCTCIFDTSETVRVHTTHRPLLNLLRWSLYYIYLTSHYIRYILTTTMIHNNLYSTVQTKSHTMRSKDACIQNSCNECRLPIFACPPVITEQKAMDRSIMGMNTGLNMDHYFKKYRMSWDAFGIPSNDCFTEL